MADRIRILCVVGALALVGACRAPLDPVDEPVEPVDEVVEVEEVNDHGYVPVEHPLVAAKLEAWQNLKFGLLMHWGPYSQWGVVESWSLCGEDEPWCRRRAENYEEYRRAYEALATTFDPVDFDPARWARAAREAGMRYVVFTTKHHDGFCMFDTQLTDYKVTDPACAFHDDPRANLAKEIFNAFRVEGMWTGAYFSKPDWHSDDYWWSYFPVHCRNPNYDLEKYPDRWERFVQFTHGQIEELVTDYGRLDILWLDGGWVQKLAPDELAEMRADPRYRQQRLQSQDLRMDELVAMARRHQPDLIVVDRAVPGPHQNYLTPENRVPDEALPYPWESCIISGGGWSFSPDAKYMPVRDAVHMLVDIVAKGGNLLLNVAPGPDGTWQDGAYELLAGIGAWMDVNAQAIYGSRARPPYKQGDVCVVNGADGAVYAIALPAGDQQSPPGRVVVPAVTPPVGSSIHMLGKEQALPWTQVGADVVVELPLELRVAPPCEHAWVLRMQEAVAATPVELD